MGESCFTEYVPTENKWILEFGTEGKDCACLCYKKFSGWGRHYFCEHVFCKLEISRARSNKRTNKDMRVYYMINQFETFVKPMGKSFRVLIICFQKGLSTFVHAFFFKHNRKEISIFWKNANKMMLFRFDFQEKNCFWPASFPDVTLTGYAFVMTKGKICKVAVTEKYISLSCPSHWVKLHYVSLLLVQAVTWSSFNRNSESF